jgi:flavodoxin
MATRTKKVKPAKKAATRSAPVPRSAPVATSEGGEEDRLRDLKLQLQAAQDKLLLIDPNKLDDEAHADWSNQIFQLSRAINKLRNVLLEQLSAEFAADLPAFESATGKLADELQRLKNAVDVINAVAGVLGVVTRIITLLG